MAKIHRNGNVIIRIADIVAAHIPPDEPQVVEIFTRRTGADFRFKCSSEESAKRYIDELEKELENELPRTDIAPSVDGHQ
jgi:hypothetical protein